VGEGVQGAGGRGGGRGRGAGAKGRGRRTGAGDACSCNFSVDFWLSVSVVNFEQKGLRFRVWVSEGVAEPSRCLASIKKKT
jgi:hypothetical protein